MKKRVRDLDIAMERYKVYSKVLLVMEVLRKEPEQVIRLRSLERYKEQLNIYKQHRVSSFIKKCPKLFELYTDKKGVTWCGLTEEVEELLQEEKRLLEEHTEKAVEYVTRLLMMSLDKRLQLDKIAHFRRDMGLPFDFRNRWVHMFPEHFRVVKQEGIEYLELTSWNPSWAVTELEKRATKGTCFESEPHLPGLLSLPFPMKFPPKLKLSPGIREKAKRFQTRSYLSPYADARSYADAWELTPGSKGLSKRAVAIMHEILSFTIDKRLLADHLTHFRQEFVMPQKPLTLILKNFEVFYVPMRGKRFSVFLTEAYKGSELIHKCPLYVWKEKILRLTGYKGRRKMSECDANMLSYNDCSDAEEDDLFGNDNDTKSSFLHINEEEHIDTLENDSLTEGSEMDVGELFDA